MKNRIFELLTFLLITEPYDINEKSAYWKKRFVHPSLFPSSISSHEVSQSSSDDDFIYHYDNSDKTDSSIDRHATVPSKVRLLTSGNLINI